MLMKPCPFPHETPCSRGPDFPGKKFSREIERCQLPLVFDVKMRWFVITENIRTMIPKNAEIIGIDICYHRIQALANVNAQGNRIKQNQGQATVRDSDHCCKRACGGP